MIDVGKAFGIRRHEGGPASLLFFYLFLIIGASMMGWTLANYVLTTREARRIFALIQLGPILGGMFVGFLTADVIHHGHLRPNALLLVVALILVGCAMLVKLLFQRAGQRLAEVR